MAEVSISYENCGAVQFSLLKGLYGSSLIHHMRIVVLASMAEVSLTYENCSVSYPKVSTKSILYV